MLASYRCQIRQLSAPISRWKRRHAQIARYCFTATIASLVG
jgi:hypothetical protein